MNERSLATAMSVAFFLCSCNSCNEQQKTNVPIKNPPLIYEQPAANIEPVLDATLTDASASIIVVTTSNDSDIASAIANSDQCTEFTKDIEQSKKAKSIASMNVVLRAMSDSSKYRRHCIVQYASPIFKYFILLICMEWSQKRNDGNWDFGDCIARGFLDHHKSIDKALNTWALRQARRGGTPSTFFSEEDQDQVALMAAKSGGGSLDVDGNHAFYLATILRYPGLVPIALAQLNQARGLPSDCAWFDASIPVARDSYDSYLSTLAAYLDDMDVASAIPALRRLIHRCKITTRATAASPNWLTLRWRSLCDRHAEEKLASCSAEWLH